MLTIQDFVKLRKAGLSTKEISAYSEDWQEYQTLENSKNETKKSLVRSAKLPETLYEEWRNKIEMSIYESGTVGIHVRELIARYENDLKAIGKHNQFLRDRLTEIRKKNLIFCTSPGERDARWFHHECVPLPVQQKDQSGNVATTN